MEKSEDQCAGILDLDLENTGRDIRSFVVKQTACLKDTFGLRDKTLGEWSWRRAGGPTVSEPSDLSKGSITR